MWALMKLSWAETNNIFFLVSTHELLLHHVSIEQNTKNLVSKNNKVFTLGGHIFTDVFDGELMWKQKKNKWRRKIKKSLSGHISPVFPLIYNKGINHVCRFGKGLIILSQSRVIFFYYFFFLPTCGQFFFLSYGGTRTSLHERSTQRQAWWPLWLSIVRAWRNRNDYSEYYFWLWPFITFHQEYLKSWFFGFKFSMAYQIEWL